MARFVSPIAPQAPFPDISMVRKFGNETNEQFEGVIRKLFNLSLEGMKWIEERETGIEGGQNLVMDPDPTTEDFILNPESVKNKKSDAPAVEKTLKQTLADIVLAEGLDEGIQTLNGSVGKMSGFLENLSDDKIKDLDAFSYHNAFILLKAGLVAHPDEIAQGIEGVLGELEKKIASLKDEGDGAKKKEEYRKKLEPAKNFCKSVKGISGPNSAVRKARSRYQFREATAISAVGTNNLYLSAQHRLEKQKAEDEEKDEKISEAKLAKRLKEKLAKIQAQSNEARKRRVR